MWESEAPAELASQWFGRSLTLPSNELVGQSRCKHVCKGGLAHPVKAYPPLALMSGIGYQRLPGKSDRIVSFDGLPAYSEIS